MENHFVNEVYQNIWKDRYCKNNESYTDNLKRVANFVAQTEEDSDYWAEQFYNIMKESLFFPGGRTMSNAGIGKHLTLNNCFVAPIIDNSMEGIFEAVKLGAITHKAGGGIGYNFSNLSPRGTATNNDAIASGPVSFMDVFDAQTATVQQGSRRGANMGVLSVYHPDIFEFLEAKSKDEKRLRHFNLSVLVDDKFMETVESDKKITLHWPIFDVYGNLLPENMWVQVVPNVSAKDLWEKIISLAYDTGEPGVLFYDTMQRNNPANYIENIVGTNPCSEYLAGTIKTSVSPQEYGGACNLGSIFLHNFVKYPFTKKAYFDFDQLKRTINIAVRFLDDIIDINKFPSKIYENYQRNLRTIGLGYTGLADMLVMLGLQYDTQEARAFVDKLMQECVRTAYSSSCALAEEKGEFPFCDRELHSNTYYIKNIIADEDIQMSIKKNGIRNAKISAVAPTGTLSLTYGNNCSSGIEPIFSLSYDRKVKVGGQEDENIKIVKMQDYAYYLYNKLKEKNPEDITVSEDCFVTALNISVDDHIAMLKTIAKYIDMSVSKTINVPTEYSFEDTKNIYYNCWKSGIKGCTIFRPNAIRQGILITNDNNSKADENSKSNDKNELKVEENKNNPTQDISLLKRGDIVECSDNLIGKKRKLQTGCGSLHVLAYFDPINGEMQEVYLNKGSTGGCVDADTEYFNGETWKKISEYKEGNFEKVLQYHEDGRATLAYPIAYIVNNNVEYLKRFSNQYGLDMVLSDDHNMFLYKNYRKYDMGIRSKLTHEIVSVNEYLSRSNSKERHVPTTFSFNAPGIPLSDDLIRLLVAVYADGSFDGRKIILSFKKQRKKKRLRELLINCDIGWTERDINNTDYTLFYVHPVPSVKDWFTDKSFTSKWYNCTDEQLKIVVEECIYWDGSEGIDNRLGEYFSSKKEEIDFIQFALTRLGFRATISRNDSPTAISYKVRWTKRNVHNLKYATVEDYKTTDGKSYCFTMPSGLLVLRRNNKIFITGNCSNYMTGLSRTLSLLCRAGVDVYTIKDQLDSTGACPSYAVRSATKHDTSKGSCCPMAIGNALIEMYEEFMDEYGPVEFEDEDNTSLTESKISSVIEEKKSNSQPQISQILCPECGEPLVFEGGCNSCKSCGYSKCG